MTYRFAGAPVELFEAGWVHVVEGCKGGAGLEEEGAGNALRRRAAGSDRGAAGSSIRAGMREGSTGCWRSWHRAAIRRENCSVLVMAGSSSLFIPRQYVVCVAGGQDDAERDGGMPWDYLKNINDMEPIVVRIAQHVVADFHYERFQL